MANKNGNKNGGHLSGGDSDFEPDAFDLAVGKNGSNGDLPKKKKKLSVERIYQKKTQLEHILLRPDTYIGSVEPVTQKMWVYDGEEEGLVDRDITFVPGLYKIFDEILVNAADHKQRDKKMDTIKVEIEPENNKISVYNNGKGIDIAMHKVENVYVPTLIFGHLLTGANFDDDEKKVVGGRNGYGAKLCNIFSTKFTVETSSKNDRKSFKQTWQNNMTKAGECIIKENAKEDFTKITFYPDLKKFNMTELDKDIVALMSRRAYDIAGSAKGVRVYLNGKKLPIKGFKEYVEQYLKDKEDESGEPIKCAYEASNDRWEIAVAMSDKGFQQVSFVNSIATTKGGRHVDHVTDLVTARLADVIKKKNKDGVSVKSFQLKNHLWVFVNCLIENPAFDSQTKESLNTQVKSFGSKCTPSEKFFKAALNTGIVESVLNWVKFKAANMLDKNCSKRKQSKIDVKNLIDAVQAGTKESMNCTLIITEGESAKTLVVAGFEVIGRDYYGVYPLRGKLLNVREATSKQISENAEICNLVKILGLQYKKKYNTTEDLKTLRYGKLMIMTDQDADGSHIKGLAINFIHHNWPSLLKLNFLEEFITPIVKATKGKEILSFFSIPEFDEWKKSEPNWKKYNVKYYKGLGTSESKEAKVYFRELERHRIRFKYESEDDDKSINLAFSKKMADARKDWLTDNLNSRKMRREYGLPEVYLYGKSTRVVTYQDFVNKELVLFSNLDNERSIPCVMDGLKPGQRKVLFTCFKRNDKKEVKVAQLAGSVGEMSAYHHGEVSLMQTIIGLAQNFVGSNNINLLLPNGQFGTRLKGGQDSASPRYIFTKLSPIARKVFPTFDDPLLNFLYDDNLKIEPDFYVPILPMVLVNGAEGIGTGWSTKIPNYNPRDIVRNIKRKLDFEEMLPMKPWYKGFRGEIDQVDASRFVVNGEVAELDDNKIEITELPVRTWTQNYKDTVLGPMNTGTDKVPAFINDFQEYHTDRTVRFVVTMPQNNLKKAESEGLHKTFKLQTTFTTTSMVLFDSKGCIKRYDSPEEILEEFYHVRLEYYDKRKNYRLGLLNAESERLKNQARFIQEKIAGDIHIENKKRKHFIQTLEERGYASDPVKKWRIENNIDTEKKSSRNEEEGGEEDEEDEEDNEAKNYDYLMDMPMKSMLMEKKEELLKKVQAKLDEVRILQETSIQDLWRHDLDEFLEELQRLENKDREELEEALSKGPVKESDLAKMGKGKKVKAKKGKDDKSGDCKPSEFGRRIEPKIDFASYIKKEPKAKKEPGEKKEPKEKKNGSPIKKYFKKKKSGSDEDESDDESPKRMKSKKDVSDSDNSDIEEIEPREMPVREIKRKAFNFGDSDDDDDDDSPAKSAPKLMSDDSDFDVNEESKPSKKKKKGSDSDDDFEASPKKKKKEPAKKKAEKAPKEPKPKKEKQAKASPKKSKSKKFEFSDSEDDDLKFSQEEKSKPDSDEDVTEIFNQSQSQDPKPTTISDETEDELTRSLVAKKPPQQEKKKYFSDSDDSEDSPPKKKKTKKISDSDESDFRPDDSPKKKKAPAKKKEEKPKEKKESKPKEKKEAKPKEKKEPKPKAPKSKFGFDSSSEDEDTHIPLSERINSPQMGATTGRSRKPVSYDFGGDSDTD